MLNLTVGCHMFKVTQYDNLNTKQALNDIEASDYIIVHIGNENYHINQLKVDLDKNEISGYRTSISNEHNLFPNPRPVGNQYIRKFESPENEVHIYISNAQEKERDLVLIPFGSIERLDIYDNQVGATIASYVFLGLGIGAGVAGIVMIVVALLKTSCPFVYMLNGDEYKFNGEIFAGAIDPNLERDDYMPLPNFKAQNGIFELKITNELKERQYTDIAELFCIEHAKDVQVLMDSYGKFYSIKNPSAPISATTNKGSDLLSFVTKLDSISYMFTDEMSDNQDFSDISFKFQNNIKSKEGKLVLNLKNTLWMDYIFERFCAQFGDKYNSFAALQRNKSAKEKTAWAKAQGMLLEVQIKTKAGWKTVDNINMVGPLASRSIIVPIDLTGHSEDNIEIRLKSGYHFWEVDYAAMDYTENENLKIKPLELTKAEDENGVDLKSTILKSDGIYLEQLYIGAQAFFTFKEAPLSNSNNMTSLFLHTRGYYQYIRNYTGKPNISELKKFKNPGSFTHFARTRLFELAGAK